MWKERKYTTLKERYKLLEILQKKDRSANDGRECVRCRRRRSRRRRVTIKTMTDIKCEEDSQQDKA